jgi:hypothetical protein
VDDIMCVWTGGKSELEDFFKDLNNHHNNIDFTLEVGIHELNFLDLNLQLIPAGNNFLKIKFDIYRKSVYTGQTINGHSFHPVSHKHAAYLCMIHRLLTIPLDNNNYKKEVSTIKHIAALNNVTIDVDKIISRKLKSKTTSAITNLSKISNRIKWVRMPFLGNISYKISRLLRNVGYRAAFYSLNTNLKLINSKDKPALNKKSGIYKICCGSCNCVYVGQTGRDLEARILEHQKAVNDSTPQNSAFAKHILDSGHNFQDAKISLLHSSQKGRVMNKLEELEIFKHLHLDDVSLLNHTSYDFFNFLISYMYQPQQE